MLIRHRACIVICFVAAALLAGEQCRIAASDATGSLLVESDPTGASVYVDGRLTGETPLTLPAITAGVHRVRMVRLGYLENSQIVNVRPAERATVRARLTDPAPLASQGAALKIVVLEGEGAVNIIQQKTAVAPVIEVRDRNDQPVPGAIVKFAIQKGKASFDGARTLTVTTNAAGRATATGFTATARGALQIGTSAAFQGQTAAATIAQTTVMTTAEASALGSVPAAPVSGGGLSHLAVAAIAGGGIAGAVVAKNALASGRTFSGPIDGQFVMTTVTVSTAGSGSCASPRSIRGTVTIQLKEHGDGRVTGTLTTRATETEIGSPGCGFGTGGVNMSGEIGGTAQSLSFTHRASFTTFLTVTSTLTFAGALDNGIITGTMNYTEVSSGAASSGGTINGSGTTTIPVTLR
jgi:hypothetical protein